MTKFIFEGKQILAVADDPDILQVLEEEILEACPNCRVDKAATYFQAVVMMLSLPYDLVLLDVSGVRGFNLLKLAVMRNFPAVNFRAVMPVSHFLNPDALKRSIEMGARTYLPKDKLGEIVPFLGKVS